MRRHYLSGVSLAVLGTMLVATLSSSAFSDDAPEPEAVAAAAEPSATPRLPHERPRVTYYVYDDESQRRSLQSSIHSEALGLEAVGLGNLAGETFFIRVATPAEEESLAFLIQELAPMAPRRAGIDIVVVDLR